MLGLIVGEVGQHEEVAKAVGNLHLGSGVILQIKIERTKKKGEKLAFRYITDDN